MESEDLISINLLVLVAVVAVVLIVAAVVYTRMR
jgi:hypothetical protein